MGFLSSRTGKIDPLVLRSGSEHIEITGRYVLAVDDGNAYLEAGLAGLGVIALPTYMAAKHRASGALIPLFENGVSVQCHCTWRFRQTAMSTPNCVFFIDWIVELMQQHVPNSIISNAIPVRGSLFRSPAAIAQRDHPAVPAQRVDHQRKRRRKMLSARVVKIVSREMRAPVGK